MSGPRLDAWDRPIEDADDDRLAGLFAAWDADLLASPLRVSLPALPDLPPLDLPAPPDGNTGAQNTGSGSRACVDWLGVTFKTLDVDAVKLLFGAGQEWLEADRGGLGYLSCWFRGNVRVYHEGKEGMGVHVEVSGQGCRQLEAERLISPEVEWSPAGGGWGGFLAELQEIGGKFSRLDVAIDDHDGMFSMGDIESAVTDGRVVSQFQESRIYANYNLSTGAPCGKTAYFGSEQSRVFVRIYDKAAEQALVGESWLRVEVQTRKERANQLALALISRGMNAVCAVLNRYLRFCENNGDQNRARWPVAEWWAGFMRTAERLRLAVAAALRTVAEVAKNIDRQYGPMLAAVVNAPGYGVRWLQSLVESGAVRWRTKHIDLLSRSLALSPTG